MWAGYKSVRPRLGGRFSSRKRTFLQRWREWVIFLALFLVVPVVAALVANKMVDSGEVVAKYHDAEQRYWRPESKCTATVPVRSCSGSGQTYSCYTSSVCVSRVHWQQEWIDDEDWVVRVRFEPKWWGAPFVSPLHVRPRTWEGLEVGSSFSKEEDGVIGDKDKRGRRQ